jgi:O-acetyl-ADP-ribose deacetylase (regulator of RNase III)
MSETEPGLLFVDRDAELVAELHAREIDAVQTADPIADLAYDWIVSPANCHGFMNGGFDLYLAKKLDIDPNTGWRPYFDESERIDMREPYLDLGTVTKWPEKDILVATTVRKPVAKTRRPVEEAHVKACLQELQQIAADDDARILCPGLGTGFGGLTSSEFAELVATTLGDGEELAEDTSMEGSR